MALENFRPIVVVILVEDLLERVLISLNRQVHFIALLVHFHRNNNDL